MVLCLSVSVSVSLHRSQECCLMRERESERDTERERASERARERVKAQESEREREVGCKMERKSEEESGRGLGSCRVDPSWLALHRKTDGEADHH